MYPTSRGVPPAPPQPTIVLIVRHSRRQLRNNDEVKRCVSTMSCVPLNTSPFQYVALQLSSFPNDVDGNSPRHTSVYNVNVNFPCKTLCKTRYLLSCRYCVPDAVIFVYTALSQVATAPLKGAATFVRYRVVVALCGLQMQVEHRLRTLKMPSAAKRRTSSH